MIKRTIEYVDFDGNKRIEDAYFNMTRTELIAFTYGLSDDMTTAVKNYDDDGMEEAGIKLAQKIGEQGIFNFVKDLVFKSYGVKSSDGRRFIKSEEISTEFTQTNAYDEFIMDLFSDEHKASDFINGIIPADVADKMPANGLKQIK